MLLGGHVPDYREMYDKAIKAAKEQLFFSPILPGNPDVLISGQRHVEPGKYSRHIPEGQHLVCFAGGMVAIASKIFQNDDLVTARKLVDGCVWAYGATRKGIMPEIFRVMPCADESGCKFDEEKWEKQVTGAFHGTGGHMTPESLNMPHGMTEVPKRSYLLRPEAIESVWVMYRITGEREWMDKGWRMFENIERATRTSIANAAIEDVTVDDSSPASIQTDKMESFWTAETLKYFYLLFSETNVVSLDEYVLNTEAHPLKRPV
jgi:mannosyl-oligosaccharide alpha-1,2-mannosidase